MLDQVLHLLPLAVMLAGIIASPFTKVEESFNTQATHDVLFWMSDLQNYDHHEFPGVVPRTFLGPIGLAMASMPAAFAVQVAGLPKLASLYAVRIVLAVISWLAIVRLGRAVRVREQALASRIYFLAVASTPHLCFYASRTLPNTLAMILCTTAAAYWIESSVRADLAEVKAAAAARADASSEDAVMKRDFEGCAAPEGALEDLFVAASLFTASAIWFRCDTLVLLVPALLSMLLSGRVGFFRLAGWGVLIGCVCLGLTVAVDSALWGKWLWPEGVVFFFNAVDNRSHEWGTEPWHWYLTRALPSAMGPWLLLLPMANLPSCAASGRHMMQGPPCGRGSRTGSCLGSLWGVLRWVMSPAWAEFGIPAMAFVALYSILPHKETRFLLIALPLLLATAAVGVVNGAEAVSWTLEILCFASPSSKPADGSGRRTSTVTNILVVLVTGSTALMLATASGAMSLVFHAASAANYPGGTALQAAHDVVDTVMRGHSHAGAVVGNESRITLFRGWADQDTSLDSLLLPARTAMLSSDLSKRWTWRDAAAVRAARAARVHTVLVHVDAAAAMSGINRFVERLPADCAVQSGEVGVMGAWARLRSGASPALSQYIPLDATRGRLPGGECPLIRYSKLEEAEYPRDYGMVDVLVTADPGRFTTGETPQFRVAATVDGFVRMDMLAAVPASVVQAVATPGSLGKKAMALAVAQVSLPELFRPFEERPWSLGGRVVTEPKLYVLLRVAKPEAAHFGPPGAASKPSAGTLRGPEAVQEAAVEVNADGSTQ
jgi:alpha-1,6-mannosyltransferase